MGYCSVPGLPGLRAEGRGMMVFHCLFLCVLFCMQCCPIVCLYAAVGMLRSLPLWCLHRCPLIRAHIASWIRTYIAHCTCRHEQSERSLPHCFGVCAAFPLMPYCTTDSHTLGLHSKLTLLSNVWQLALLSCFYDGLITIVWEIMGEPTDWLYVQWGAVCEWLCASGLY